MQAGQNLEDYGTDFRLNSSSNYNHPADARRRFGRNGAAGPSTFRTIATTPGSAQSGSPDDL
jgi:hypothetical protein